MSSQVRRTHIPSGAGKAGVRQDPAGAKRQVARPKKSARPLRRRFSWGWALFGVAALLLGGLVLLNTVGSPAGQQTSTNPLIGNVTETAFSGTQASGLLPVGSQIPDLRYTLAGTDSSIGALRGRPLLLEFFATWCPHCQAEAPVLSKISDRFKERGLQLLAVNSSQLAQDQRGQTSPADVDSYINKYGARYPHLMDSALIGARRFGIRSFPTLYLVDSTGVVRMAREGEVPEQDLVAAIEQALTP